MSNYVEWDDVIRRYSQMSRLDRGAKELNDSFIDPAERELENLYRLLTDSVEVTDSVISDILRFATVTVVIIMAIELLKIEMAIILEPIDNDVKLEPIEMEIKVGTL